MDATMPEPMFAADHTMTGVLDIWRLIKDGAFSEAIDIYKAIKAKDINLIEKEVNELLVVLGFPQYAKEIHDLTLAIKANDATMVGLAKVATEALDIVQLILKDIVSKMPQPAPAVPAPPSGPAIMFGAGDPAQAMLYSAVGDVGSPESFSRTDAKKYFESHKATVRESAGKFIMKLMFRRTPEVLDHLGGKAPKGAINPETIAKIIKAIEFAIPILTALSAGLPWLIPVVVVLRMIVAAYKINHPDLVEAVVDRGLALEDLA